MRSGMVSAAFHASKRTLLNGHGLTAKDFVFTLTGTRSVSEGGRLTERRFVFWELRPRSRFGLQDCVVTVRQNPPQKNDKTRVDPFLRKSYRPPTRSAR